MSPDDDQIRVVEDPSKAVWSREDDVAVLRSPWLSVTRTAFSDEDGRMVDEYYIVDRPDVVVMCAVTETDDIVLVGQYRYGIGRYDWELPGGGCQPGESTADAARRELLEETGFVASSLRQIAVLDRDAASSPAKVFVFLGYGRFAGPGGRPHGDEADAPGIGLVSWSSVPRLLLSGQISEQTSVAALSLAWQTRASA